MRITHAFHPLCGHEIELIGRRQYWGEDRLVFKNQSGRLCTISSAWTDIEPADEFRRVAAGRAAFCTIGLLALCDALDRLVEILGANDE